MSSTVKYLRELADQIERGVTLCLDVKIDEDEAKHAFVLRLTYRSLANKVSAAGLAVEGDARVGKCVGSEGDEAG